MKRTLAFCILSSLAGMALAAPPAAASAPSAETDAAVQQQMAALQARMNALASRMAALSTQLGNQANASALHYLADSRRGMFGMAVSPAGDGLRVDAVTPGGPAERAGIKAGDIITGIGGKHVASHDELSFIGLAGLPAGKPVQLDVTRAGKAMSVTATPERLQSDDWEGIALAAQRAAEEATAEVRSPEFQKQIQQSVDDAMQSAAAAIREAGVARESANAARDGAAAARAAAIKAGRDGYAWAITMSPWWGLNLAPLNPELGRYFGTGRGVLVLSRNDRQFPELQPGDVITAIDGKPAAQPEDVQRALRSAGADQRVPMALRRHDKTLTLALKVPPRWTVLPPAPPPPPPPPPAPPKIAAPPPPAPPAAPPKLDAPPPPAPPAPPPVSAASPRHR